MNVDVRILSPVDLPLLDCVDDHVFDNAVDRNLAATFLNDDRHHLAAAVKDGRIVMYNFNLDGVIGTGVEAPGAR
jgi:hypothetical protein